MLTSKDLRELADGLDNQNSTAEEIVALYSKVHVMREVLVAIAHRPNEMKWGEDWEVNAAMNDMERLANETIKAISAAAE